MANTLGNIGNKINLKNLIKNSDFNAWSAGVSSVPNEWALVGSGAVEREDTIIYGGLYSFKGTVTSGNAVRIQQRIDEEYGAAYFQGRVFVFKVWVKTDTASKVRLQIVDSVGFDNSSYHTGGDTWELLSVTRTIDAAATQVVCKIDMADDASGYTAYVDLPFASEFLTINNTVNDSYFPGTSEPNDIILRKSAAGADVASDKIDLFSAISGVDKKMTIQQQGISSQEAIEFLDNSAARKHYFDGTGKLFSSLSIGAPKLEINQTGALDSVLIQDGGSDVFRIYDGGISDLPLQSAMLAYQPNATDAIATAIWTRLTLMSTEVFDIQGEYDGSGGIAKFIATKAGYYLCYLQAFWDCTSIAYYGVGILKNGMLIAEYGISPGNVGWRSSSVCTLVNLAATDYIQPYVFHNAGANRNVLGGAVYRTYMWILKVM